MMNFHKYMVAISRIEVNHDGYGGTAPDATICDNGSILKPRSSSLRFIVDHASLLAPIGFRDSSWCSLPFSSITQEDVAVCPYSVNIFLEFTAFFWPHFIGLRMGKFGISYLELLVMFKQGAGQVIL